MADSAETLTVHFSNFRLDVGVAQCVEAVTELLKEEFGEVKAVSKTYGQVNPKRHILVTVPLEQGLKMISLFNFVPHEACRNPGMIVQKEMPVYKLQAELNFHVSNISCNMSAKDIDLALRKLGSVHSIVLGCPKNAAVPFYYITVQYLDLAEGVTTDNIFAKFPEVLQVAEEKELHSGVFKSYSVRQKENRVNVFFRNLPADMTEEQYVEFCRSLGPVRPAHKNAPIPFQVRLCDSQRHDTKFGFCTFESHEVASEVLKKDLNGVEAFIHLSKAELKEQNRRENRARRQLYPDCLVCIHNVDDKETSIEKILDQFNINREDTAAAFVMKNKGKAMIHFKTQENAKKFVQQVAENKVLGANDKAYVAFIVQAKDQRADIATTTAAAASADDSEAWLRDYTEADEDTKRTMRGVVMYPLIEKLVREKSADLEIAESEVDDVVAMATGSIIDLDWVSPENFLTGSQNEEGLFGLLREFIQVWKNES